MNADARRAEILQILQNEDHPVSASKLAARMSVSRQIIVGDIALLRAAGSEIMATPRGYIIPQESQAFVHKVACRHTPEEMRTELYAMVDQGCTVRDVIVEHPVYGELKGALEVSNRHDVDLFVEKCRKSDAVLLSGLTGGVHLHTLACPDEDSFLRAEKSLRDLGMLLHE